MASVPTIATAIASPSPSLAIPKPRDDVNAHAHALAAFSAPEKLAAALLTPPNSISPDLPAHGVHANNPPPMDIANEMEGNTDGGQQDEVLADKLQPAATPLSKGALSGLDAAAAITPSLLAQDYLPGIMLGNGPRPIRYVMGELTQSVPGFSRIPPAKARRLVVAALESRHGGGPDGSVTFCKTGWGRWDAHVKGSSRDSGIGSFGDGHMSPPRSERSSYAMSNNDSGVQMRARMPSAYRDQHSGGSWPASSLREEDELLLEDDEMDMDVPENEADKMSLDGDETSDSISSNEDTDEESNPQDWTTMDLAALRKASLPIPGAPRINYNAIAIQQRGPSRSWTRRPSRGMSSQRSLHSSSLPYNSAFRGAGRRGETELSPATATPEEQAAVAALLSLGSM